MNRTTQVAMASLVLAALAFLTPSVASAAQKWDLNITPVYFLDNTGDSGAPPPPGTIPFYCPNGGPACPAGSPIRTQNLRLDYSLTYFLTPRWNLQYAHSNFDFSLGRILSITPLSILTGSINDRTDKGSLNYAAGHGLSLSAYYSSTQRVQIEATSGLGSPCYFNSEQCIGNTSNPASINSNLWGLGAAYTFGPHVAYQPPMFKVGFDINYYPRPASGNCASANPQPACGSGGINGYVGSGAVYPWSITVFPFSDLHLLKPGTIPFFGYSDSSVWFHAENTPETYNVVDAGLVQILPHGLSLSYTYFKLNGRQSSDTIPPPDTIRSATSIFKLSYDLHF
ncbi:MAG: hypothetical protein WCC70_11505 [Candidatus Aquilonibacter sp.]